MHAKASIKREKRAISIKIYVAMACVARNNEDMAKTPKNFRVTPRLADDYAAFCTSKGLVQEGFAEALLFWGMHATPNERDVLFKELDAWKADPEKYVYGTATEAAAKKAVVTIVGDAVATVDAADGTDAKPRGGRRRKSG